MATGSDELEQFKTQINLCDYAESLGFTFDRKQSSKRNAVMRHASGAKIAILKRSTGHWVYINTHGSDSGSIVDFVQAQKSLSIGKVRKELRPWISGTVSLRSREPELKEAYSLEPADQDLAQVADSWMRAKLRRSTDRYLRSRGIPEAVLNDPIFLDRIRVDDRNNTIFPHWNAASDLCGFEIKNDSFTGFSPGGEKGLWCSRPRMVDRVMVICETAIDSLSVATLFGTEAKRFFSTAGQCSPHQIDCLASAAENMPDNSSIWLAVDNDDGGKRLASLIRKELEAKTANISIVDKIPEQIGSDWNDVVRARLTTSNIPSF